MRNHIEQQNPYQVRNKRFRRRAEDNESGTLMSISRQRRQQYQSPSSMKVLAMQENRQQDKPYEEGKTQSLISVQTQNQNKEGCQAKYKQKIRRKSEYDQELQFKFRGLQQLLKQKEERIKLLQTLLEQKNTQNSSLKAEISLLMALKTQKLKNQERHQQQIHLLQLNSSQEMYKLKQKVKKYEIELACTNKKWKDEFDRICKEKDQEIRVLRQKFSSLLRSNREKSKTTQIYSQQLLPATNARLQKYKEHDSLELSSFQLSK